MPIIYSLQTICLEYKRSCEKINVACPDIIKNEEGITGTQIRGLRGKDIHKVLKFLKDHH